MRSFFVREESRVVKEALATSRYVADIWLQSCVQVLVLLQVNFLGEAFEADITLKISDLQMEGVHVPIYAIFIVKDFGAPVPVASEQSVVLLTRFDRVGLRQGCSGLNNLLLWNLISVIKFIWRWGFHYGQNLIFF